MVRSARHTFRLALYLLASILGGVVLLVIVREFSSPPLPLYQQAMRAIDLARQAEAARYAPQLLSRSIATFDRAETTLNNQHDRWFFTGSYAVAESLLTAAETLALEAARVAHTSREAAELALLRRKAALYARLDHWKSRTPDHLQRQELTRMTKQSAYLLGLADAHVEREQLDQAAMMYDRAEQELDRVKATVEGHREAAEQLQPLWDRWVRETVAQSAQSGKTAIIVDKQKHRLYVYRRGRLVTEFPCELGFNSGRQKLKSGDGATPEGKYVVSMVKMQSKYYRALLLDYPNHADRERFNANRRSGVVPASAKIGGLIEIHGHGGQGYDWTEGCVAVEDHQMDSLLAMVGANTPVTIVRQTDAIGEK